MTADLTPEIIERLRSDDYGWLTTVAKSGQPVPKLVWFFFDGTDIVVYTEPGAAKVRHIRNHPPVSLNLDSDGNGGGIIVIGGPARVDAEGVDLRTDTPYWAKYQAASDQFGLTDSMGNFSTRLRITIEKVWTTPTE
ncbi:TIGR03667 family PPOX class F420-dependent oxidoreductase [Mycobacterium frederiksbergense]|uniref:TIGR03667 family PPOX class F420-dependent oxidoreductase n=1 Tax=Mycolicibacterium frederiksbergense TaxID=117567 RepID=UPI0021F25EEE|nr:TIGR03667 family PPOX class F420-dependent oxidoreductase [Mycolicibacterium frederiksbergense]MCV7045101.1 TIGR03667 family PPOX class F420-dependent oxidoreductase [Mycolicibacterium frederiksbergense]